MIVYGYPSDELQDDASRGKVALGGCLMEPDNPKYRCKSCGQKFGGLDKFLKTAKKAKLSTKVKKLKFSILLKA